MSEVTFSAKLHRLEEMLAAYFNIDALVQKGWPTGQYIAGLPNVSPGYLTGC